MQDNAPAVTRIRRVSIITALAAIAPLTTLGVALTATSWWDGLTITVGFMLALGVLREWSLDGYPRRAVFAFVFTVVAWFLASITASSPISFVVPSVIGAMLLARRPARRILWVAGLTLGIAAIGAASLLLRPPTWTLVMGYLIVPILGTLFIVAVILLSEQAWLLVRRLERAKEVESELAVARERVRFAGDLHDIQGHSLHVIKLKAALARQAVRTDPSRAEEELGEIRRLADETISETRALAYARHDLNLAAELENAKRLFEATGIIVEATLDLEGGEAPHPLLAQALREATTNVLRHARPAAVSIAASPRAVKVVNDGATEGVETRLRGLARLRERVEAAGGTLHIERPPGGFAVSVHIHPSPAAIRKGGGV